MGLAHAVAVALVSLLLCTTPAFGSYAEPVRVDFYMEALCPYCAQFTLTQLQPLFKNKLINFVELDVIPWGNARTDPKTGEVTCQHGALECELNKLISCAIAQHPRQDDWFPFLTCLEETVAKGATDLKVEDVAGKCGVHAGMVKDKLLECHKGDLGKSLQRLAAQRTASLKPPHQYVPWVVVNGIPLLEDDENIMKYICVAYTGRDRPSVCYDMPKPPSRDQTKRPQLPWQPQQQQQQRCRRGAQPKQQQQQRVVVQ
eukprot:GHUV01004404.1.p1 GENE.GHUV01004404.1~~GHUV01004404.1.p1  ORF type:complete len:258 (+),score=53.98 GHUV01004404.1:268-1041(+)